MKQTHSLKGVSWGSWPLQFWKNNLQGSYLCTLGPFTMGSVQCTVYYGALRTIYCVSVLCAHSLRCIEDDPEAVTNSIKCKVRLVYRLQSVPHPMNNAPITLPHHVTLPEMKTCCRYGQVCLRFKVQHNYDGCCHSLVICLLCFNISSMLTHWC